MAADPAVGATIGSVADPGRERDRGGPEYIESTVYVNRVAKVVKGGRRFSFNALVCVGDGMGKVGVGLGKSNEISDAIRKAGENAKRSMMRVPMMGGTIPFTGARKVRRRQSDAEAGHRPVPGVIAGGAVRAIMEIGRRTRRAVQVARLEQPAQSREGDDDRARPARECARRRQAARHFHQSAVWNRGQEWLK